MVVEAKKVKGQKNKTLLPEGANPYGCVGSHNDPINKLIISLDEVAYSMELKWGRGVLPQLVDDATREKFQRVLDKLNEAISMNDYDTVKVHSENLIRGWRKLDEIATASGKDVMPCYTKAIDKDGVEYLIVTTELDAQRLSARMPHKASSIYTSLQIANLLTKTYSPLENRTEGKAHIFERRPTETEELLNDSIPF